PSVAPSLITAQSRPYACRLLSAVRVLYVDEGAGVAYLELTPYQSHTIWALQAAGLQLWGERYGAASAPLQGLDRLDIGQVTADDLESPASAIPGSTQP
ncbi:MAG: flagellar biosynthesis protein FlgA, partial [Oscillochloris sp.]|nr:flagellar biosynthesis protein FlgA [Oscillochloris sp.]